MERMGCILKKHLESCGIPTVVRKNYKKVTFIFYVHITYIYIYISEQTYIPIIQTARYTVLVNGMVRFSFPPSTSWYIHVIEIVF